MDNLQQARTNRLDTWLSQFSPLSLRPVRPLPSSNVGPNVLSTPLNTREGLNPLDVYRLGKTEFYRCRPAFILYSPVTFGGLPLWKSAPIRMYLGMFLRCSLEISYSVDTFEDFEYSTGPYEVKDASLSVGGDVELPEPTFEHGRYSVIYNVCKIGDDGEPVMIAPQTNQFSFTF